MKIIENLAFKGGGVLGAAYAGALTALEEYKLVGHGGSPQTVYGNVKRVAGTSAGSICATLVALGHNAAEINTIMGGIKFKDFADLTADPLTAGGLCSGNFFLEWMRTQVEIVLGNRDATFADLAARSANDPRFKDLHVFSNHASSGRTFEFCAQSTPGVSIAEAARASMSIPIFYVPWTFPLPPPPGKLPKSYRGIFVDGGVAFNYPISAFDSGPGNNLTLGVLLEPLSYDQEGVLDLAFHAALDILDLPQWIRTIAEALLDAYEIGPLDSERLNALKSRTLADAPQGGDDLSKAIDIVGAASEALKVCQTAGPGMAIRTFRTDVEKHLGSSPDWQEVTDFLTLLANWYSVIGTLVNTPTNVVFERDAQRSIVINTLGYSFVDFWMPECNKRKLIAAGYNSASQYLGLFMYS